jgi:hypothetical protein
MWYLSTSRAATAIRTAATGDKGEAAADLQGATTTEDQEAAPYFKQQRTEATGKKNPHASKWNNRCLEVEGEALLNSKRLGLGYFRVRLSCHMFKL